MSVNSGFLKSIKITQESFVIAIVLEFIFAHFFEIILFTLFMIYFKVSLLGLAFYPIIFLLLLLFTLGMSFILATIGAYINDFNNIWDVFGRLLWFVTPIFYLAVPGTLIYKINSFNPLFYYVTIAREIVVYSRFPDYNLIFINILFSLSFFLIGIFFFLKNKNKFAEMV
jgi:ABC-type polysaccharide/polyol phosphate export permease